MTSSMRFTTVGLTDYETNLIDKLFIQIRKKTVNNWIFAPAKRSEHFDLMIARERPVGDFTVDILVLLNDSAIVEGEVEASWPLRIFDILHFVQMAEKAKGVFQEVKSSYLSLEVHKKVLDGNQYNNLLLSIPTEHYVLIDLLRKRVVLTQDSESAINSLIAMEPLDIYFSSTATPKNFPWKTMVTLREFLWRIARSEKVNDHYRWSNNSQVFNFTQYPNLSGLEIEAYMLKLAALFSRAPCTIKKATQFSGVSESLIKSFLHACRMIGTPLNVEYMRTEEHQHSAFKAQAANAAKHLSEPAAEQQNVTQDDVQTENIKQRKPKQHDLDSMLGMLGKFRNKLGTVFVRSEDRKVN